MSGKKKTAKKKAAKKKTVKKKAPEKKVEAEEIVHAECSPSQLKRVLLCPGSRRLKREAPEEKASDYAIEGTMLHEVTERKIYARHYHLFKKVNHKESYYKRLDANYKNKLTKEQYTVTEECVEYFESLIRELQLTSEIESVVLEGKTSLEWYNLPEVDGYVDVCIKSDNRIDIIDWKFGQGVPVSSKENPQGMAYAAGSFDSILELTEKDSVHIHIVQPRLNSFTPWHTSGSELFEWVKEILYPGIVASRKPDAPCIPGDACNMWCVGPSCTAREKMVQKKASEIFEQYTPGNLHNDFTDDDELAPMLKDAKMINSFITELTALALQKCISGEGFPGYKAVAGRSFRYWVDEKKAEEWLQDKAEDNDVNFEYEDLYVTKFVTVAAAEKLDQGSRYKKTLKRCLRSM